MALTNKIEAFKNHFNIDSIRAVEFILDTRNNLVASLKTKNIFLLIKETMNSCRTKMKFTKKNMELNSYTNSTSEDWDNDSYSYVNEYGQLMFNEECCKTLKIPKSLWPFMCFSFDSLSSVISNYRYDLGPKF